MSLPRRKRIKAGVSGLVLFVTLALSPAPAQQSTGTALVRHGPMVNGKVEGSIRQMTAENATLNGGASVNGDLLVPGTPTVRLNGSPSYGGTQDGTGSASPTNHTVTLNGGASLRHVIRRTDAVALPNVAPPPPPTGTRSVSLNKTSQSPGDFATLKNLTLNGNVGAIAVPPGTYGSFSANSGSGFVLGTAGATIPAIYNFQNLHLNSNSTFAVVGPVVVTIDGGFSTNTTMGSSDHPEWLKLRIAGGGLSLAGNRVVYAHLEAPDGTLTLNGDSRFIGAVAADRLIVNGKSLLRLAAPVESNQAPAVTLVIPAEGAVLPDTVDVALWADARDADGSVARVDFYDGTMRLGEGVASASIPVVYRLTFRLAAGQHVLVARAVDQSGLTGESAPRVFTVQAGPPRLPAAADFEQGEGYQSGPLQGQNGWASTEGVGIASAARGDSEQEVQIGGGSLPETLIGTFSAAGLSPVFVDYLARPVAGSEPATSVVFATAASRVALVQGAPFAELQAAHSDGAGGVNWQGAGPGIPLDPEGKAADWLRLSVREDYATKKWDLYANGRMIAADLAFADPMVGEFGWFTVVGHPTGTVAFDNFYAGAENPVAADADRDGMDDAWETGHGLNPALNDRDDDTDHDGLTNVQEYVLETDPNNPDSDGDGMPDGWEARHGLNPLVNDAGADPDGDTMGNREEYLTGRSPIKGTVPDTAGIINLRVFQPGRP